MASSVYFRRDMKEREKYTCRLKTVVWVSRMHVYFAHSHFSTKLETNLILSSSMWTFSSWLQTTYWLWICALVGSTKHVKIIVFVDKESARVMNSGEEKLEDILVLHLEGGKDFFVSFSFLFLSVLVGQGCPCIEGHFCRVLERWKNLASSLFSRPLIDSNPCCHALFLEY